jgi:hypothetical protein
MNTSPTLSAAISRTYNVRRVRAVTSNPTHVRGKSGCKLPVGIFGKVAV